MTKARRPMTTARAVRTTLGAVLALGVAPAAVARVAGGPRALPTVSHAADVLTARVPATDEGLIGGLTTAFWVAVVWLAVSIVFEVVLRVTDVRRDPLILRPALPIARRIIAAVAFLLASARTAAPPSPAMAMRPAVAVVATAQTVGEPEAAAPESEGWQPYIVRPGDTVWGIARKAVPTASLLRVSEVASAIERMNVGRAQPSYGGVLRDPNKIHPGWTLLVPQSVSIEVGAPVPTPEHQPLAGVAPGPAPSSPDATPATQNAPATPATANAPAACEPSEVAPPATTPLDTSTVPRPPESQPPARGPAVRHAPGVPSKAGHRPSDEENHGQADTLMWVLGGVAIAAASAMKLIMRRRRANLLNGAGLARCAPPEAVRVEEVLHAIADEDRMVFVDGGNRMLLRSLRAWTKCPPLETVLCARIGRDGLELLIEPPARDAPEPWLAQDDGRTWRLSGHLDASAAGRAAAGESPALPALVAVGETDDGAILVDLEQAGVLVVEGSQSFTAGIVDAIVLQLATAPWCVDVQTLVAGPGTIAAPGHIARVDEPELLATLDAVERDAARFEWTSPLAARIGEQAESWGPTVVVLEAEMVAPETLDRIRGAVQVASGRLAAVVASCSGIGANWRIVALDDDHGLLEPLGLEMSVGGPPGLGQDAAALLDFAEAVASDDDLHVPSSGQEQLVLRGTEPTEPAEGGAPTIKVAPELVVGVLGPIVVPWPGEPPDRQKPIEAVVYLATHERAVAGETLRTKLWPLEDDDMTEAAESTFRTAISRARAALGRSSDGRPHLPEARQGCYSLGPFATSDWLMFHELWSTARRSDPVKAIPLLRQALELVRGAPFEGAPKKAYGWAWSESIVSEIEVAIGKAADRLGQLALAAGDPETAAWAAHQGLRAVPYWESLHRVIMRAAAAGGDLDGVEQAWRDAKRAARSLDVLREPQDETAELYEELRCRSQQSA